MFHFQSRSTGFTYALKDSWREELQQEGWGGGGGGVLPESLRQIYHRHVGFTHTHSHIDLAEGAQDSIAQIAHCWGNICNKFSLWLRPNWHLPPDIPPPDPTYVPQSPSYAATVRCRLSLPALWGCQCLNYLQVCARILRNIKMQRPFRGSRSCLG